MKNVLAIFLAILFIITIIGFATAQSAKMIEIEKKRLQIQIDNTHLDATRIQRIRDKMHELEQNPELYFLKYGGIIIQ